MKLDRQYRRDRLVTLAVALGLLPFAVLLSPIIAVKMLLDITAEHLADDYRRAKRRQEEAETLAAIERMKEGA